MYQKSITVGLIGIPGTEERRLAAAFEYSQSRNIKYTNEGLQDSTNILMVNADEPASLIKWRSHRNTLEEKGITDPPSVLVTQNREFNTMHFQVKRPLITTRVISVLDQVTQTELGGVEEQAIEPGSEPAAEENNPPPEKNIPKESSKGSETKKALVVDDSLPVRIQMDKALSSFANVDFAVTGEEAFTMIENNEYNIIFLDVVLPGVDGYEVCKTIKEGKAKNTPVIMLTGNSSPADRIKGKLAGCDTYLIKPVNQIVFQEVVNEYLNSPRLRTLSV